MVTSLPAKHVVDSNGRGTPRGRSRTSRQPRPSQAMRRVCGTVTMVVVVAGIDCGARTPLRTAPVEVGVTDAGGVDSSGKCQAGQYPAPSPRICTAELQRECQAWASTLITNGYAHSLCWPMGQGNGGCLSADERDCVSSNLPTCSCGNGQCASNEACVSDTLGGPSRCRHVCLPDCTPRPCSAPGEACWCATERCADGDVCILDRGLYPRCSPRCPVGD